MSQPSQSKDTTPGSEPGEPAGCKGNSDPAAHPLVELGSCGHAVTGSIHTYTEYGCPECGAIAKKGPTSFMCGRGIKARQPTAENCLALKWKAERLGAQP